MKLVKKSNALTEGNTDPAALFEPARESIANLHSSLQSRIEQRRERALKDPDLRQDDHLADAYRELLDTVAGLHRQFDAISEKLAEHGTDADKPARLH